MHEGWGNQSPEQAIKYTAATLICFGSGISIMELMGYFWGCVKGTYTGPVLEPYEVRGRLLLISTSFGWDAWFPCAADTSTNYWHSFTSLDWQTEENIYHAAVEQMQNFLTVRNHYWKCTDKVSVG